jgi:hypothetical protein
MGFFGFYFGPQFAQLEGVARGPAFGRMGY